jgi:cytochrome P450
MWTPHDKVDLDVSKPTARATRGSEPPIALVGSERVPVAGIYHRLKAVIMDPTRMVLDYRAAYGDLFTVRIPFRFDLTYLLSRDGHDLVMSLDPHVGRIGPVFQNIPCVGFGFPKSDPSDEHLQALVMAGRSFIATQVFTREAVSRMPAVVRRTVREHLVGFGREIDLAEDFVAMAQEAAARACVGDALWDRVGDRAQPLLRCIADGIDIPRAAINNTPLRYLGAEYHASRRLHRELLSVIEAHDRTSAFPLVDRLRGIRLGDRPLPEDDVPWMMMYVLWNAFTYPGSYAVWGLVDVLRHDRVYAHLRALRGEARRTFLVDCFHETARLSPVASVVRKTSAPIELEHEGRRYTIPPGGYVGTFPYVLCRDARAHADPDAYDPFRYGRGEALPPLYGRGVYGCPARRFMRTFAAHLYDELLARIELRLLHAPEPRRCRVHLTYPRGPLRARVAWVDAPSSRAAADAALEPSLA